MSHKTNVNTTKIGSQANIAKSPLVLAADHTAGSHRLAHDSGEPGLRACLREIDMHADDIESQALAVQTLCGICFEVIDGAPRTAPDIDRTMRRLDALLKAVYRNAVLVQEAADGIAALVREGGAA